ncbi:MAG: hypothetical protein H8D23_22600 [Candidatus Brocadiales bacterium]|nr:hypothetical protein [Candidatus Brocadiales bacterium]
MSAGLNIAIDIWRMTTTDDDVGGAVVTGTVVHSHVPARMQPHRDDLGDRQSFMLQGLQVDKLFTVTAQPGTLEVFERDEIEVVAPVGHPYYQDRFRIIEMDWSDINPGDHRNYLMFTVSRDVKAHASQ